MNRVLLPIVAAGIAVRLLFLWLAGSPEPIADESNYLTLALSRLRFGFYSDSGNFLWPPGYPFILFQALREGGVNGVMIVRLLQVLGAGVVGLHVLHFAHAIAGTRAARIAGWIWVFSFPLIEFTHTLWPETLFLALFLTGLRLLIDSRGRPLPLLLAGALFGLSLFLKESTLYYYMVIPLLLLWRHRDDFTLSASLIPILSVAVVIAPWMTRNQEYYGAAVMGSTLGENVYKTINAGYRNFDYPAEHRLALYEANGVVHSILLEDERAKWIRSREKNVIAGSQASVRKGMAFILEDPFIFAKSRIKRAADFLSPHSFFVRHLAMGRHERIQSTPIRQALGGCAILLSLLTMASAALGFGRISKRTTAWTVFVTVVLYFTLLVGPLGGLTRYRAPIEPILIVLAGLAWGGSGGIRESWQCTPLPARGALVVLALLWAVNAREWVTLLALIGGAS